MKPVCAVVAACCWARWTLALAACASIAAARPTRPPQSRFRLGGAGLCPCWGDQGAGITRHPPDIITGTSAGAVVGSLYAAGYSGIQLQKHGAGGWTRRRSSDLVLGDGGFVSAKSWSAISISRCAIAD